LRELLPDLSIGVAHGQMRETHLDQVMSAFYHQRHHILLCTSIIETGIDIPNANTIIIERADKFGLAQLHQLRGRVGRGAQQSSCVLLFSPPMGVAAKARLGIMRETSDGFRIAEKDLELRGPGEVLGTRQTGMLQFRVADLARDQHLLDVIPAVAECLLADSPETVNGLINRWIGDARRFAGV